MDALFKDQSEVAKDADVWVHRLQQYKEQFPDWLKKREL